MCGGTHPSTGEHGDVTPDLTGFLILSFIVGLCYVSKCCKRPEYPDTSVAHSGHTIAPLQTSAESDRQPVFVPRR